MSTRVSSWVWHDAPKTVTGNDLIVLLALADVADDNGRCRYITEDEGLTYRSLERKARVSKSTVIRTVGRLREAGLIDQVPGSKGRPNEFRVLVPWAEVTGVNLTPNVSESGGSVTPNAADSVSSESTFGVNPDSRSSLKRIDVNKSTSKTTSSKGSRLPEDWKPGPGELAYAAEHAPSIDIERTVEDFVDYWVSIPGQRGVRLDWSRTWQTWVRRAHDRNVERGWVAPAVSVARPAADVQRDAWLAARGVTYEEFLERKNEPGWLASLESSVRRAS